MVSVILPTVLIILLSTLKHDFRVLISMLKKVQLVSCNCSNNCGAIDVKVNSSVLEEFFFKVLGLSFSLKLDLGSHSVFIAEIASKKVETLICSMKFLPPKITLYLCKSNIMPSMEYFCHVELGASSSHLDILYKLQKQVWRTLVLYLLPLLNPWLITEIQAA